MSCDAMQWVRREDLVDRLEVTFGRGLRGCCNFHSFYWGLGHYSHHIILQSTKAEKNDKLGKNY